MLQSASHFADQLMGVSTKMVFDDWTWRLFGYRKRPKRGAFFNRFLSESNSIRETFLVREIFLCCCASGLVSLPESCSKNFCIKIGNHIVDTVLNTEGVTKAFRFTSKKEATDYLMAGLNKYIENGYDNFTSVFFDRAQTYTEKHFKASWLVYVARLVTDYHSPVYIIRRTTFEKFNSDFHDDLSA